MRIARNNAPLAFEFLKKRKWALKRLKIEKTAKNKNSSMLKNADERKEGEIRIFELKSFSVKYRVSIIRNTFT